MFLSKLTINVRSREFRRDYANVYDMHRTVMSAFPDVTDDTPRQACGVLWRLDSTREGFVQYVQSHTTPDWRRLPAGYLTEPATHRSLQPVLDALTPGRRLAFRMVANPTHSGPAPGGRGTRGRGKRLAHTTPDKQIEWLIRQGGACGFAIPAATNGEPDVAPSPSPMLGGRNSPTNSGRITIRPVRYDGHLVITDADALAEAIKKGIGRAKAFGCGLLSLAPARTA